MDDPNWDLEQLEKVLAKEEIQRCRRLIHPIHQRRQLVSYGVLRRLLGDTLECNPADLTWHKGEHGKPSLTDRALQFNLSHSEGYALLGMQSSRDGELGVDLEDSERRVEWQSLAERFFTKVEVEATLAAKRPRRCFFEVWTAKEAYIKALGSGLSHPLDQFLTLRTGQPWGLTDLAGNRLPWHLQRLESPWPTVVAAWVSQSNQKPTSYFYAPEGSWQGSR